MLLLIVILTKTPLIIAIKCCERVSTSLSSTKSVKDQDLHRVATSNAVLLILFKINLSRRQPSRPASIFFPHIKDISSKQKQYSDHLQVNSGLSYQLDFITAQFVILDSSPLPINISRIQDMLHSLCR